MKKKIRGGRITTFITLLPRSVNVVTHVYD